MRTTITLDDDVVAKIKDEMKKTGGSFKQVVNEMIRTGALTKEKASKQEPFVVKARPLGLRPGINYDSFAELMELTEKPDDE